jgi:dethiobiotin synthetase
MRGIFVAGTGTDVGKTMVTAGLLRWLRRRIADPDSAMVMKPVQTGCKPCERASPQLPSEGRDGPPRLRAPDVDFVLRAAGLEVDEQTFAHVAPYCFQPACSPHLAARLAGQRIEMERILQSARWLAARYRRLVVEGAGGLLVPVNDTQTMLCVAWQMRLPVLLVGPSGLGTINHTLLSLEALRRRGCPVLGVMLNDVQAVDEAQSYIHEDNVRTIEHYGEVPVRRIPYLRIAGGDPQPARPGSWATDNWSVLDAILDDCEFLKEVLR